MTELNEFTLGRSESPPGQSKKEQPVVLLFNTQTGDFNLDLPRGTMLNLQSQKELVKVMLVRR